MAINFDRVRKNQSLHQQIVLIRFPAGNDVYVCCEFYFVFRRLKLYVPLIANHTAHKLFLEACILTHNQILCPAHGFAYEIS